MTTRYPMKPLSIRLTGEAQRKAAHARLDNMPIDADEPIEVIFREEQKIRKMTANDRMWAGPLRDIAEQAWLNGRQFSAEIWHEYFKAKFLPSEDAPDLHLMASEGYRKWITGPAGDRVLVGSTTQLLKRGFALYMLQVEAFGANLGVQFSASPREHGQ